MDWWDDPGDLGALQEIGAQVIGRGILSGRLQLGLSQRQLAWRVHVSQSTISRLENGRIRGLGFKKLATIVGLLGPGCAHVFAGGPAAPRRRLPGQDRTA